MSCGLCCSVALNVWFRGLVCRVGLWYFTYFFILKTSPLERLNFSHLKVRLNFLNNSVFLSLVLVLIYMGFDDIVHIDCMADIYCMGQQPRSLLLLW